jgi:hypothetical protein
MQNNYQQFFNYQIELEKRRKEELLRSRFFQILQKDNEIEYNKLMNYLKNKNYSEIEEIITYIIKQKSVQKN